MVQDETWRGSGGADPGGMVPKIFYYFFLLLFWIWKYFQFDFPRFQDAIWKILIQEFQNRAYFLPYVIFQFSKFGRKLSTFGLDTLYIAV